MGGRKHAAVFGMQRLKNRIPRFAGRQLQRITAFTCKRRYVHTSDAQRNIQSGAERYAEGLVTFRLLSADAVMDVDGRDGKRIAFTQLQEHTQKRD